MSPLLITYPSPEARDSLLLPLFVSSNASPLKTARYEPAGSSFHSLALRILGLGLAPSEGDDTQDGNGGSQGAAKEDGSFASSASSESFYSKGKKKGSAASGSGQGEQDHYALIGLGHLRFLATEDQVRKSYRECALKFHPDKQASLILAEETEEKRAAKKEEIDQHFKAIQKAYEVLIDPVKRRIYDSTDEFDDDVPGDCAPKDFFKVYGPVFLRNAKWSVSPQVPVLGDDNTPLDEVDKFYDFWNSFKSWREFPDANEYDLDEAESREHKRWMERQNAKLSEKARKEESVRIRTIVENAYKRDPRILKRREDEKAEKLRRKQAKIQAKLDKEEEAARLIEEEKARKEQEEKRALEEAAAKRKNKERERKLLRKEKSRLRSAASDVITHRELEITEEDIEHLCSSLDSDKLRSISESVEGKPVEEKAAVLQQALATLENPDQTSDTVSPSKDAKASAESSKIFSSTVNASEKKERPWSKEEVELLRKAMTKYPKGTSQRWEVISTYIGTNRSVEEILKAIKTVLLQKPDPTKAFDSFLEKRKVSNVVIESPLSIREDSGVESSSSASSSSTATTNTSTNTNNPEVDTSNSLPNGDTKTAVSVGLKAEEKEGKPVVVSNGNNAPLENGKISKNEQDVWSDVQESSLIKALKAFPKDTPQRWERISTAVPGKTKAQCFKKFSELKENFRSKKVSE